MFLAVAGLATFGISCSSDDNSSDGGTNSNELIITADKYQVEEGETVNFTIKADGKEVADAEVYVNNQKAGKSCLFAKEGIYKVVAKKENFKDSKAIEIKVTKGDTGNTKKSMVLAVDRTSIAIGETIKFSATENGVAVSGFVVKLVGGTALNDNKWTSTKEGEFKFVASKEGHNDSNEVTIKVSKDGPAPKSNYLTYGDKSIDLAGSGFFYFVKGDYVYSEVIEGKTYVPFRLTTFTIDITERINATDYENSASLLFFVEQKEDDTKIILPWDITDPSQLFIVNYDGEIEANIFKADQETKFTVPLFTAPVKETGRGTVQFKVEGNDITSKAVLKSSFDGPFQAYYKVVLEDTADAKSVMSKDKGTQVDYANISSLRRK